MGHERFRVVYISGYGRSGSTILDAILGNLPDVFGAGELSNLFDESHQGVGPVCACGRLAYGHCPFWSRVLDELETSLPGFSLSGALRLTRRVETVALLRQGSKSLSADEKGRYGKLWRTVVETIARRSGCATLVDSSKSMPRRVGRITAIHDLAGLPVSVIHLVRDPRAVMWSVLRGENQQQGLGPRRPFAIWRSIRGWMIANLLTRRVLAANDHLPSELLRYESLISDPVEALNRVGTVLGIDPAPVLAKIGAGEGLVPGHGLAGNRARRLAPMTLSADDEWRSRLPAVPRLLALLTWPLARRYGYDLWHQ